MTTSNAALAVRTSPVPQGLFESPLSDRHVLCLHVGAPVPVSYRAGRYERDGVRIHGQFCIVPAQATTRRIVSWPSISLLLCLVSSLCRETTHARGAGEPELAPWIHIRDAQIERIGWMMQAEDHDGYPGGRLFADSLGSGLAIRLPPLQ